MGTFLTLCGRAAGRQVPPSCWLLPRPRCCSEGRNLFLDGILYGFHLFVEFRKENKRRKNPEFSFSPNPTLTKIPFGQQPPLEHPTPALSCLEGGPGKTIFLTTTNTTLKSNFSLATPSGWILSSFCFLPRYVGHLTDCPLYDVSLGPSVSFPASHPFANITTI